MNIAKLNTASLDDKTYIIKRGTSGGGTPDTPPSGGGNSGWRYYKIDKSIPYDATAIMYMATLIKRQSDTMPIAPMGLILLFEGGLSAEALGEQMTEIAVSDFSCFASELQQEMRVLLDELSSMEITAEQFYSLE